MPHNNIMKEENINKELNTEISNMKFNYAILEMKIARLENRIDKSVTLFQELFKEVQALKQEIIDLENKAGIDYET